MTTQQTTAPPATTTVIGGGGTRIHVREWGDPTLRRS